MKVIINGYNLIRGGGLSVGIGITKALLAMDLNDEVHLFLPKKRYEKFCSNAKVTIHFLPKFYTDCALGRWLAVFYLSTIARKLKAQAIISLGNYAMPTLLPQLLLLQWPYAVYPEKYTWSLMPFNEFVKRKLRLFFLKLNLKYAHVLTVQTHVMKSRVREFIHSYKGPICVIESAFNKPKSDSKNPRIISLKENSDTKILLCMSEYYIHKNIEILIPLANLIRKENLQYKIAITLDPEEKGVARLLRKIHEEGLDSIIVNIGRVPPNKVGEVYNSCDALLLPTLLETFGIPYLEAAYSRLPVLTSDLDFAHEINGDNAWYFDPLSESSILATIQKAFSDPISMQEKVDQAFLKVSKMKSWEEITMEYLKVIKNTK